MSTQPDDLRDTIPSFDSKPAGATGNGPINFSALSTRTTRSLLEKGAVVALAAVVFFGLQAILEITNTPTYVLPKPFEVVETLVTDFRDLYAPHLWVTLQEFLLGLAIGSTIGLVLAAVITQKPFVEKMVAPYILIMVTTPMIALIPFLRLKFGLGITPIVIAVALASGPMVLINASTGFRRADLAKIALARSYGASTFQIFCKVRFPLAMPMIIVGYMVGSIFGLLTAVGAELTAASERGGLGHQLGYFASLLQMPQFGAVIVIVAALGVAICLIFQLIGKRWASWEA